MSIAEIREKIKELEEKGIPEARQLKEDCEFVIFFQTLIIKGDCN